MSITIDEVESSIDIPTDNPDSEEAPQSGPAGHGDGGTERNLQDTIRRLEHRQLRLMAD